MSATSASSCEQPGLLLVCMRAMIVGTADGDLAPARTQSGELAAAAQALHASRTPGSPRPLGVSRAQASTTAPGTHVRRLSRHVEQAVLWEPEKGTLSAPPSLRTRALDELADGLRIYFIAARTARDSEPTSSCSGSAARRRAENARVRLVRKRSPASCRHLARHGQRDRHPRVLRRARRSALDRARAVGVGRVITNGYWHRLKSAPVDRSQTCAVTRCLGIDPHQAATGGGSAPPRAPRPARASEAGRLWRGGG